MGFINTLKTIHARIIRHFIDPCLARFSQRVLRIIAVALASLIVPVICGVVLIGLFVAMDRRTAQQQIRRLEPIVPPVIPPSTCVKPERIDPSESRQTLLKLLYPTFPSSESDSHHIEKVHINGLFLEQILEKERTPHVVLEAIFQNPEAIQYAPESTPMLLWALALYLNPNVLPHFPAGKYETFHSAYQSVNAFKDALYLNPLLFIGACERWRKDPTCYQIAAESLREQGFLHPILIPFVEDACHFVTEDQLKSHPDWVCPLLHPHHLLEHRDLLKKIVKARYFSLLSRFTQNTCYNAFEHLEETPIWFLPLIPQEKLLNYFQFDPIDSTKALQVVEYLFSKTLPSLIERAIQESSPSMGDLIKIYVKQTPDAAEWIPSCLNKWPNSRLLWMGLSFDAQANKAAEVASELDALTVLYLCANATGLCVVKEYPARFVQRRRFYPKM